jgi:hypothetical protein
MAYGSAPGTPQGAPAHVPSAPSEAFYEGTRSNSYYTSDQASVASSSYQGSTTDEQYWTLQQSRGSVAGRESASFEEADVQQPQVPSRQQSISRPAPVAGLSAKPMSFAELMAGEARGPPGTRVDYTEMGEADEYGSGAGASPAAAAGSRSQSRDNIYQSGGDRGAPMSAPSPRYAADDEESDVLPAQLRSNPVSDQCL